MAPKKKSNKKQDNLEEPVEPVVLEPAPVPTVEPVVLEPAPVPNVEPVVLEPAPVPTVEPVVLEPAPASTVEPVVLEPAPASTVEPVVLETKKEATDLEINEILNPLLSNDLENLLLQNVERPKSPPPRRINRRGATMGMKLGF
jgi:hypothetical protein